MADEKEEEFMIERTLGEGAFGKVYLVSTSQDNGDKYAMKVMDLTTSKAEERELALQEADVLRKFNHPHVLHYITSFEKDGLLCIVTEYCPNGDLAGYLEARQDKHSKLEENQILTWFFQTAQALKYLHGLNALHRDLKCPNIFLDANYDVRLGDMGLTKVLEKPNAKAVTFCGSPYYMSPEIFSCKPYDSKSDIWALGVIVYEMSTLERPFEAMLMHQLVFKVVHGSLPNMPTGYCKGLVDLIAAMLSKDPDNRPTATQIVENAIFKNMKPTKPSIPPKPTKRRATNGGRDAWGSIIMGKSAAKAQDADFSIADLLGTLSKREHQDRFKPKTEKKCKISKYEDDDALATIAADKYKAAGNDKSKTVKSTNWNKTLTSSRVELEFTEEDKERTLKANQQTEAQAMDVMALVIRTLTRIFPKALYPDSQPMDATRPQEKEAMLLRNIEQLQYYCMKVLDNDQAKFQKAYDILGTEKQDSKLEESLIKLLGGETWALIGVQLMYLKNFEYNIMKLQQQMKPVPAKTTKKGK
ncbi:hypothetical protein CHS0354_038451 [Potamilus streckersoni]|uniref:non-specific serine/threonine protein kinase n=1 Tax=Potamilus streckersoni TaxID=2493646 RepID=A0AAE0VPY2_9BIVA|nr:hypothetical protein CHS0354_038451 [Potamilus streckersoni]